MPDSELRRDTERQLQICNACRYCEGYCAVFPAVELRRSFGAADLAHLANLCFECRACYYACPYAPPHEFAVNLPRAFAQLRVETYRRYVWPGAGSRAPRRGGLGVPGVAAACCVSVPLLALLLRGPSALLASQRGPGAFYAIVPYDVMVWPAALLLVYGVSALAVGCLQLWRDLRGRVSELLDARALARATGDALRLAYMKGGGAGCSYPDARPSHTRRWLHHLMFYGFLLALASTTLASVYHNLLERIAPYPLWSGPVLLGSVGGIAMLLGAGGLLVLKRRSDPGPTDPQAVRMDTSFLLLLLWTNATGLALLAARETGAMGWLLVVHLGAVAGLFVTLPYGKLAHAAFRYASLIWNAREQSRAATPTR